MEGSTQNMQPTTAAPIKKKSKLKTVLVWLLIIALIGGAGTLGYFYKTTNDKLRVKSQELSSAYTEIERRNAVDKFIMQYNDSKLSNNLCGSQAVAMFDVHLTSKYAVFKYMCSNLAYRTSITVGAFKKNNDGTYEFTYGGGSGGSLQLPGYIYDTDVDFFSRYYGVKRI